MDKEKGKVKLLYIFNEFNHHKIKIASEDNPIVTDLKEPEMIKRNSMIDTFEINIEYSQPFTLCLTGKEDEDKNILKKVKMDHEDATYFIFDHQLIKIEEHKVNLNNETFALMTDLDGTLLGDEEGLKLFNRFWLKFFMLNNQAKLIYNTARSIDQIVGFKKKFGLLWPDICICNCGTKIYTHTPNTDEMKLDEKWNKIVTQNWDCGKILKHIEKLEFLKYLGSNLVDDNLIWCQVKAIDLETFKHLLEDMIEEFKAQQIFFKIIINGEEDSEHRFLDIIPINGGKNMAMKYISEKYKILPINMLCCGDSSNDIFMLEECEWGLLVSNAYRNVKKWYEEVGKNKQNFKLSTKNNAFAIVEELKTKFNLEIE